MIGLGDFRRLLVVSCAAVAFALCLTSAAAAHTWDIWVTPTVLSRGQDVTIHTSSSNRRCSLLLRIGRHNLRTRFHKKVTYTLGTGAALGKAHVKVTCGDYYATDTFLVTPSLQSTAAPPAPAPTPAPAPWTVANVCSFNPGLGPVHTGVSNGMPWAAWLDGSGAIDLLAWSTNGDNAVDDAAVIQNNQIAYIASCNQTRWLNVAVIEAQKAASLSTPASQAALEELDNVASEIGALNPVTPDGPGCAGPFAIDGGTCYVEPVDPY